MPARDYYRDGGGRSFPGFPGIGVGPKPSPWVPSHVRNNAVTRQQDFLQQCRGGGGGSNSSSGGNMPPAPGSFGTMFQQGGSIAGGGPSSIAGLAASMIPAGVTEQSLVLGGGSRGGDMTAFASLSLCSQTENWTARASYTSGLSGKSVGLSTAYSGSGGNTSVLGSIHVLTAASIMQLTDRRTDRLSMGAVIDGAIFVGSKIPAAIRLTKDLGRAILLAEGAREKAEANAKAAGEKSTSSAATGGPKGQLPDGEDPEKEENHTQVKDGDFLNEHDALEEAEKFLGEGYTNPSKDRYVSADGTRQVRMKDRDVLGKHAGGPHIHLEYIGGTNAHVYLK